MLGLLMTFAWPLENPRMQEHGTVECQTKGTMEQHLSDIRRLVPRTQPLLADERDAALRAEHFAITLLKEHHATGHDGKRCPFATVFS